MWKHINVKGRYLSLHNGRLNARQSVLTVGYLVYMRPCLAARLRKRFTSFGWWLIHNSAITGIFRESPVRTLSWQIIIPVNNNNSYGKYHACTTPKSKLANTFSLLYTLRKGRKYILYVIFVYKQAFITNMVLSDETPRRYWKEPFFYHFGSRSAA